MQLVNKLKSVFACLIVFAVLVLSTRRGNLLFHNAFQLFPNKEPRCHPTGAVKESNDLP